MELEATNGTIFYIDDEDFPIISQHSWRIRKFREKIYVMTNITVNGLRRTLLLHRLITNAPKGMDVDHINNNGLINTKENLRVCTRSQNMMNMRKNGSRTSNFKGVYKDKNRWHSQIRDGCKNINLGRFDSEVEAAEAYNAKAVELFGEYASINKF